MNREKRPVLDFGYVQLIECDGTGLAGRPSPLCTIDGEENEWDYEVGIIEAARQSTQASFRTWEPYWNCNRCGTWATHGPVKEGYDQQMRCTSTHDEHDWQEYPRGDMGLLSFLFSGKPQHATPFEFSGMTLEIQAPIMVFREWHRETKTYQAVHKLRELLEQPEEANQQPS